MLVQKKVTTLKVTESRCTLEETIMLIITNYKTTNKKVNLTNYLGSGSNVYYFAIPLQDAINSMERDGFFQASYNQSEWWNVARAESWSCGTEDDLDSNIGLYSYDAGARTTTRGVLCAGDFDSNDIVNENIESIFYRIHFIWIRDNYRLVLIIDNFFTFVFKVFLAQAEVYPGYFKVENIEHIQKL